MKPRIKETIEFTTLPENKNTVQGNSKNVRLQNATHKITAIISKYLSILYIIFFIYKYHDNHKNAGNPEKKCTFSLIFKEKAHKKSLYTSRLGDIEEENNNIKKNICVSYILKVVAACCN